MGRVSRKGDLLMEQFLKDVLAAFVAGVLVAIVVDRWLNRRR